MAKTLIETLAQKSERVRLIVRILRKEYPEAKCSLEYQSPYELLVSTVLSAQCTDERVNRVTPAFFKKFPDARMLARASLSQIETLIRSTGFFKSKARALKESAQAIVEKHGGQVPATMDELTHLRGVGRKTANVILGNAFGVPSMPVDTHIARLSFRIGLTTSKDPVRIEQDLMQVVPRKDWVDFSHLLIFHGRKICTARKAFCEICPIAKFCPKLGVVNR